MTLAATPQPSASEPHEVDPLSCEVLFSGLTTKSYAERNENTRCDEDLAIGLSQRCQWLDCRFASSRAGALLCATDEAILFLGRLTITRSRPGL